jgi:hypothetical protein
MKEHFRPRRWHCRHGFSFGREGKMVDGGGKELVGAWGGVVEEREVGGVVLVLVVREEEGVDGWEKERSGVNGMIRVSFGRRVLGIMRLGFRRRVLVVVCAIVGNLDGAMWNVRVGYVWSAKL